MLSMPRYIPTVTTYQVWWAGDDTNWFWFYEQRFAAPEPDQARRAAQRHARLYRRRHPDRLAAFAPLGTTPRPINRSTIEHRRRPTPTVN